MSEHEWTSEHIAALAAGGLDAAETERAEAHVQGCGECEAALNDALALDRRLSVLFTTVRPAAALEDRVIQSLHRTNVSAPISRSRIRWGWQRKLALGVAASIGLGIVGAGLSAFADGLPMPGDGGPSLRERLHGLESTVLQDKSEVYSRGLVQQRDWLRNEPDSFSEVQGEANSTRGQGFRRRQSVLLTDSDNGRSVDPEAKAREMFSFHIGSDAKESDFRSKLDLGIGLDPNLPSNYNVDRIENLSVPGKVQPDEPVGNSWGVRATLPAAPNTRLDDATKSDELNKKMGGSNATSNTPSQGPTNGSTTIHYYKPTTTRFVPVTETKSVRRSDGTYNFAPPKPGDPKPVSTPTSVEGQPTPTVPPPVPEAVVQRKIIRSGDIEFEIDAFDTASATVIKLVEPIQGGFVATINSEKLANGKVKGSIVVRIPPGKLDQFVLDLRRELGKVGELKGQRIGSQDVTKQYYDTESRLKAARYMEQRLLAMIKEGKGDIKQLLEAEKELGVWRTKIDEMEGEKRYFDNQVSLSTLTITLAEKEIRAAAGLTEIERVQTGIEVEDVEHAHRDALAAVTEAKGRVTKSEIKQMAAGQFTATLNFEVAPEQAGPVRDRLKQLGRTARLEVDRVQQAEGGTPQRDSKVKRGDTQFLVQFYNLANIAPRESAILQLAAPDVPTAYRTLVDAVSRAKGRVIASKLDENDRENVNAQLDFEVRRSEDAAIVTALAAAGETISRNVNRAADTENVTDGKVLYRTTFVSAGKLRPREVITLGIEVENVDATIAAISSNANEAKGRVTDSNISRQPNGKMAAVLAIDVPHSAAPAMSQKLASLGAIKKEQRVRNSQAPQGQYSTARFEVVLANRDALVAKDEGFGAQVRKGLSYSAEFLLKSMTWIVFGLCVVLPWAIVGYGVYRVGRWLFRSTPEKSVAPTPTPPPAGQ